VGGGEKWEVGGGKLEAGSWRLEIRSQKSEVRSEIFLMGAGVVNAWRENAGPGDLLGSAIQRAQREQPGTNSTAGLI
jgi:hypothetical protein